MSNALALDTVFTDVAVSSLALFAKGATAADCARAEGPPTSMVAAVEREAFSWDSPKFKGALGCSNAENGGRLLVRQATAVCLVTSEKDQPAVRNPRRSSIVRETAAAQAF